MQTTCCLLLVFTRFQPPSATQADVFEYAASDTATAVMDGFNACLMLYGQTGAGKTHTATGPRLVLRSVLLLPLKRLLQVLLLINVEYCLDLSKRSFLWFPKLTVCCCVFVEKRAKVGSNFLSCDASWLWISVQSKLCWNLQRSVERFVGSVCKSEFQRACKVRCSIFIIWL